jgi:hypothetical protein
VNCNATPFARNPRQNDSVAQYDDRIVARHIERNELTAGGGDVCHEAACTGYDDRAMSGFGEDAGDLGSPGISRAAIECRHDDQYGPGGMRAGRRAGLIIIRVCAPIGFRRNCG